jgi:arylformamidase
MRFFDATYPLSSKTIPWPKDTRFSSRETRGTAIVSRLIMSSHSGTHIDAPRHFVFQKGGVDAIDVKKLIGPVIVANINSYPLITLADVKRLKPQTGARLIFKTRNQRLADKTEFDPNYVSLSLEAAKYLASLPIYLVGIDYLGIEAKSAPGHPVHKTLLKKDIVIIEGLNLKHIRPGKYNMAALPLKIKNGDGAPARVVLWK